MDRLIGFDPQLLHDAVLTGINIFFYSLHCPICFSIRCATCWKRENRRLPASWRLLRKTNLLQEAMKAEYEAKLRDVNKEAESILETGTA